MLLDKERQARESRLEDLNIHQRAAAEDRDRCDGQRAADEPGQHRPWPQQKKHMSPFMVIWSLPALMRGLRGWDTTTIPPSKVPANQVLSPLASYRAVTQFCEKDSGSAQKALTTPEAIFNYLDRE